MIFTISFLIPKAEVLAIGRTLLPNATDGEILMQQTVMVSEWARTTLKRKVREIMETRDANSGAD